MFIVLLFLKILYNKVLLYPILTVSWHYTLSVYSSPYQLLRSDAEAHGKRPCNCGDLFGKQTRKWINFNRLFFEGWCQETLKLIDCNYRKHSWVKRYSTTARVISLNVIGQSINKSYILKRNVWPFYVNQRCHWWISLRGGARNSQRYGTTLKVL